MDMVFNVFFYGIAGFFGLILVLVMLALLFGKRVIKQWDFEAEFLNDRGREIAEFEIESSRIEKEQPDFSTKANFQCKHAALAVGDEVAVYLDDVKVMAGQVENAGRIRLTIAHVLDPSLTPEAGQNCTVKRNGELLLEQVLRKD
jgi:hypothetical protein